MPIESANALIGVFFGLTAVIVIAAVCAAVKKEKEIYGENSQGECETHENVKVLAKNRMPHPRNPRETVNIVIFELEDRTRVEFAVKDNMTYERILVDDTGVLCFCGKQFVSFEYR